MPNTPPFACAAIALVSLMSAACTTSVRPAPSQAASNNDADEQYDGIARARLHERVYVDGPYVTPLEVVKDTRCPTPLQCYVAGDFHVKLRVDLGSRSEEVLLKNDEVVHIADGNLRLVEIAPDRRIAKKGSAAALPIAPEDYRLGFRFMGGY